MKLYLISPYYIEQQKKRSMLFARARTLSASTTVREWIDTVTDRNSKDVDRLLELLYKGWNGMTAAERVEWLAGMKGALNRSDLERIESNVQLLSDVLELDLYTYVDDVPEIPDEMYYENLLQNVSAIREAYCIHASTPPIPDAPMNTYGKVNDVEEILLDVYSILMNNFHYYCGDEIYSGDSIGALL